MRDTGWTLEFGPMTQWVWRHYTLSVNPQQCEYSMVTLNLLHNKREPIKHECGPITQYQLHGEFEVLTMAQYFTWASQWRIHGVSHFLKCNSGKNQVYWRISTLKIFTLYHVMYSWGTSSPLTTETYPVEKCCWPIKLKETLIPWCFPLIWQ
jgi:hypothetical protein